MKEIFKFYKEYLTWVDKQNRLINMRNGKKRKAAVEAGRISAPENLEQPYEVSLEGFLEWGANEKA